MLTPGVSPEQLRGRGWLARAPWGAVGLCPWPLGTFHWFFFMWLTALGQPPPGQSVPRRLCPRLIPPPLPWQRAGRPVSRERSPGPGTPGRGHVLPGESLASLSTESSPAPQTQGAPDYGCPASTLGVEGQREGAPPSSRATLGKNSGHKRPSALGCGEPLAPGPRPASRLKAQAVPSWGLTMSWEPGCRVQACPGSKGIVGSFTQQTPSGHKTCARHCAGP